MKVLWAEITTELLNHLMWLKCHLNNTISCALKRIWVKIQHITVNTEVRQCSKSNKKV